VQHISIQSVNTHHQVNFSVQMNACTGQNGSSVARQKDIVSDKVSGGEFLWVVIIGEYNVANCWSFSGIDAYPPHVLWISGFSLLSYRPTT